MTANRIANHRFEISSEPTSSVSLGVYSPEHVDGGEFQCLTEVTFDGRASRRFTIKGEGALQALLLSLSTAALEIELELERMHANVSSAVWDDLRKLIPPELK